MAQPNLDQYGTSLRAIFNNNGEVLEKNDTFKCYFEDNVISIENILNERNSIVNWQEVLKRAEENACTLRLVDECDNKKRILKTNISKLKDSNLFVLRQWIYPKRARRLTR